MKRSLLFTAIVLATLFGSASVVKADYGCNGQYGTCPTTQTILIDKTVGKIVSNNNGSVTVQYVDNLSPSDPRFKANSDIFFQLRVKNTSSTGMYNVKVVDYVPAYLEPVEGPGNFDTGARTITFYLAELRADEEKTFTVKMRVVSQDKLDANKGLMCINNRASASTDTAYDEDTAQFCVEKQVLGVTQVPSTGPEFGLALLAGNFVTLGAGLMLKRKSK